MEPKSLTLNAVVDGHGIDEDIVSYDHAVT